MEDFKLIFDRSALELKIILENETLIVGDFIQSGDEYETVLKPDGQIKLLKKIANNFNRISTD
ncbi:MAG: hypothetical protein WC365_08010 [Candidatus Babeliales bacterium]|jgi:hypothetical protein